MAINFLSSIDLNKNQLLNARIQNLATDPAVGTSVEGQIYFNTTDEKLRVFNSTSWEAVGDITAVTSSTTDQLTVANGTGPAPALSIVTGTVAAAGTNLVTSAAIHAAIAASADGTVTSIVAGTGLTGGTITSTGTIAVDYAGTNNFILEAQDLTGTNLEDGFKILYSDTGNDVSFGDVSDLPFTANAGTMTSVTGGSGITITGTASVDPTIKVNDTVVRTTGAQTIAGVKTFTSQVVVPATPTNATNAASKGYVLSQVGGVGGFRGGYNATTNTPELSGTSNVEMAQGDFFVVSVAGNNSGYFDTLEPGDFIFANAAIADSSDPAVSAYTVVIADQNIAGAGANDGATVKGVTGFSSDSFAVTSNGFTTIKNDGVILGTQTSGAYVEAVTTGTGLDGAIATEGSTAALALDFNALTAAAGELFIMLTDGEKVPKRSTAAQAAGVLNGESTFATSIGDGSASTFAVTHGLGTDVIIQLYDNSSGDTVYADTVRTSATVATISFGTVIPPTNDIRVLVQKIG